MAASGLEPLVSLDTLKSACQNSQTKPPFIWGKHENVEKYHIEQLSTERGLFSILINV